MAEFEGGVGPPCVSGIEVDQVGEEMDCLPGGAGAGEGGGGGGGEEKEERRRRITPTTCNYLTAHTHSSTNFTLSQCGIFKGSKQIIDVLQAN